MCFYTISAFISLPTLKMFNTHGKDIGMAWGSIPSSRVLWNVHLSLMGANKTIGPNVEKGFTCW